MTIDIVVHIENKLATVKNVSVNVSDTSPRTSKTMENEDANVKEKRNATNAGTLSDASRHRTFLRNCLKVRRLTRERERERELILREREREREHVSKRVSKEYQQHIINARCCVREKKEQKKENTTKCETHRIRGSV
jgi:hypothetical protein